MAIMVRMTFGLKRHQPLYQGWGYYDNSQYYTNAWMNSINFLGKEKYIYKGTPH